MAVPSQCDRVCPQITTVLHGPRGALPRNARILARRNDSLTQRRIFPSRGKRAGFRGDTGPEFVGPTELSGTSKMTVRPEGANQQ